MLFRSQSLTAHKDIVTCLAISSNESCLVSGSRDTTLLVWEMLTPKGAPLRVNESPLFILYGHSDDVTCVAIDVGCDICVSGSKDGTCIVHNLRNGTYLRTIPHPLRLGIELLAISALGHIVFFSQEDLTLFVYTINGEFISQSLTKGVVRVLCLSRDAKFVVTGEHDTLCIYNLFTLECIQRIPLEDAIVSITLNPDDVCILAALANGNLVSVIITGYAQLS